MNQKIAELKMLLRASPKKAGLLGGLGLVLVVLGGKQLVGQGPGLATASSGTGAVDDLRTEVLGLSDITELVDARPSVRVPTPSGGMRDLFRFDERRFPPVVLEEADAERSAKSDARVDDPSPVPADAAAQERAHIRDEAERFRLTSTLLGSESLAVFDYEGDKGQARTFLLRIGEDFQGFTLLSVSHRAAVIVKDGHEFTLRVDD